MGADGEGGCEPFEMSKVCCRCNQEAARPAGGGQALARTSLSSRGDLCAHSRESRRELLTPSVPEVRQSSCFPANALVLSGQK